MIWLDISKQLESVKHLLWHGNAQEALDRLPDLSMDLSRQRETIRGAHLLLQTRTKVLNNGLEEVFRHLYPRFRAQAA